MARNIEEGFEEDKVLEETKSHDDLVADVLAEGEEAANLDAVAGKEGDLTADDIREAVGDAAEGLTDEELLAGWAKAQKDALTESGEAVEEEEEKAAPEPLKLEGFKLYDDKGVEIDVAKLKPEEQAMLKQFLNWQFGYNAMGKEQRKKASELARVASLGHYNESKMQTLVAERAQAAKEAREAVAKISNYEKNQAEWDKALTALINGNPAPMQRLAELYQQALGQPLPEPVSRNDTELEAAGQRFILETVVPRSTELAKQYGANATEITQYALYLMEQEGEFLTREKIEAILQYEMPNILEQNGYNANGKAVENTVDPRDAKIAALEKQMAGLIAGKTNAETEKIRAKTKKAPPAGGGSVAGTGETMPDITTKAQMKEWLHK